MNDIVSSYKEQWQIEGSFRTIKSFIEIRPVYHRKSDRIRGHVFVCVLSLLISRIMEKLTGNTIKTLRNILNQIDVVPITVEDRIFYISSINQDAESLLNKIPLKYPRIIESAHT